MRPVYIACGVFAAVLTPHFREQLEKRRELIAGQPPVGRAHFLTVYQAAKGGQTFGYHWGRAYLYGRKVFNRRRSRWELELISITPDNVFHTHNHRHAVLITPNF